MRKYPVMAALILLALAATAEAWNHFGHMTVAAIAYERLTPKALDDEYMTAARDLAEQRIALAGLRLANLLNDIFDRRN